MILLVLGVAGGVGAVARFLADGLVARFNPWRFPLGTVVVNITGSALLGLITGVTVHAAPGLHVDIRTALGTGLCGGYTTFSTASVEAFRLAQSGSPMRSIAYAIGTAAVAIPAAFGGLWLGAALV